MPRWLRFALIWLVAFALPIQGFAAAAMLFCGKVEQHAVAVHDHADHDHGAHGKSALTAAMSDDAGHAVAGVTDKGSPTDALTEASGTCSVCASCCTAAALPTPVISHDPPLGDPVFQAVSTPADSTFIAGGLDRPPRLLLA